MMLVQVLLVFYLLSQRPVLPCEDQQSTGHFRLQDIPKAKQPINQIETKVAIREIEETLEILTFRRRMYYKYCYEGGPGDPNTGCSSNTVNVTASPEEIRSYNQKSICKIGFECQPYGDCWGSWANERCKNTLLNKERKGDTHLKWIGESWMKFPYHTCIQSWECLIHKEVVEVYITSGERGTKEGFELPTGEFVEINQDFLSKGFTDKQGYLHIPKTTMQKTDSWMEEMYCLGSKLAGVICKPKIDSKAPKISLYFLPGEHITYRRNMEFTLVGDVLEIGMKGLVVNNYINQNEMPYTISDKYDLQSSASISDIISITDSLHYVQIQSIYNVYQLEGEVTDIKETLTKLIRHLMPKDPWLLSSVLDKGIYTKNIDKETFSVYHCQNPVDYTTGNCVGDMIYKEGTLVKRVKDDLCLSYPENEITNLTVFSENKLDKRLAGEGKIGVSSRDSSTWAWLVNYKYSDQSPTGYEQSKDNWASGISETINSLTNPFSVFSKYFTLASSILSWILLIILCIRR